MGYSSDSSQPMEFGMESGQRSEKKHSRIGNLLRAMRSPSNVQLTKDEAASTFSASFDPSMSTTLDLSSRQPFFVLAFCTVVIVAQASTAAMQTWWPPTASVTAQGLVRRRPRVSR